jgi:hypothetical protein
LALGTKGQAACFVHAAFIAARLFAKPRTLSNRWVRPAVENQAGTRRGRRRPGDFSPRTIAALFALLSVVAAIPVLTNPLPPLSDYINHLARMHVITALKSDPLLANFYELHWAVVPNLIMDLIVPVLHRWMDVYLAGEIFLISIFVVTLSGTLALNRALFGYWSAMPLLAFPLLYNGVLLVGVMNYLFGIGIAVWALALWIWLRDRPWPLRFMVSQIAVLLLFFCHLFAVGLYGIGLLAFEVYRQRLDLRRFDLRRYAEFLTTGIPFLIVAPLLLVSPTLTLANQNSWEANGKIEGITLVFVTYYDLVAILLAGVVIAAVLWALRYRVLHFHRFGWFLLAIGGATYLAMPRVLFATYMADQRLPIGLAFMVAACLHLELTRKSVRQAFAAVLVVLLAIRVGEVQIVWQQLSQGSWRFKESVTHIEPGSRVLVAYADQTLGDHARDLGYIHAACLAMIEKSSLVTTAFTVKGKQILQVRPAYQHIVDEEDGTPPQISQLLVAAELEGDEIENYWDGWPRNYDYVYLLFTEQGADNPDSERLLPVYEGKRFHLYKVIKPAPPKAQ